MSIIQPSSENHVRTATWLAETLPILWDGEYLPRIVDGELHLFRMYENGHLVHLSSVASS